MALVVFISSFLITSTVHDTMANETGECFIVTSIMPTVPCEVKTDFRPFRFYELSVELKSTVGFLFFFFFFYIIIHLL